MDLEDFDLYNDLDEFASKEAQKTKEFEDLEKKYKDALKTIDVFKEDKLQMEKQMVIMKKNFQILLDTAKAEIARKDKRITELNKEKDDICFRRKRPKTIDEPPKCAPIIDQYSTYKSDANNYSYKKDFNTDEPYEIDSHHKPRSQRTISTDRNRDDITSKFNYDHRDRRDHRKQDTEEHSKKDINSENFKDQNKRRELDRNYGHDEDRRYSKKNDYRSRYDKGTDYYEGEKISRDVNYREGNERKYSNPFSKDYKSERQTNKEHRSGSEDKRKNSHQYMVQNEKVKNSSHDAERSKSKYSKFGSADNRCKDERPSNKSSKSVSLKTKVSTKEKDEPKSKKSKLEKRDDEPQSKIDENKDAISFICKVIKPRVSCLGSSVDGLDQSETSFLNTLESYSSHTLFDMASDSPGKILHAKDLKSKSPQTSEPTSMKDPLAALKPIQSSSKDIKTFSEANESSSLAKDARNQNNVHNDKTSCLMDSLPANIKTKEDVKDNSLDINSNDKKIISTSIVNPIDDLMTISSDSEEEKNIGLKSDSIKAKDSLGEAKEKDSVLSEVSDIQQNLTEVSKIGSKEKAKEKTLSSEHTVENTFATVPESYDKDGCFVEKERLLENILAEDTVKPNQNSDKETEKSFIRQSEDCINISENNSQEPGTVSDKESSLVNDSKLCLSDPGFSKKTTKSMQEDQSSNQKTAQPLDQSDIEENGKMQQNGASTIEETMEQPSLATSPLAKETQKSLKPEADLNQNSLKSVLQFIATCGGRTKSEASDLKSVCVNPNPSEKDQPIEKYLPTVEATTFSAKKTVNDCNHKSMHPSDVEYAQEQQFDLNNLKQNESSTFHEKGSTNACYKMLVDEAIGTAEQYHCASSSGSNILENDVPNNFQQVDTTKSTSYDEISLKELKIILKRADSIPKSLDDEKSKNSPCTRDLSLDSKSSSGDTQHVFEIPDEPLRSSDAKSSVTLKKDTNNEKDVLKARKSFGKKSSHKDKNNMANCSTALSKECHSSPVAVETKVFEKEDPELNEDRNSLIFENVAKEVEKLNAFQNVEQNIEVSSSNNSTDQERHSTLVQQNIQNSEKPISLSETKENVDFQIEGHKSDKSSDHNQNKMQKTFESNEKPLSTVQHKVESAMTESKKAQQTKVNETLKAKASDLNLELKSRSSIHDHKIKKAAVEKVKIDLLTKLNGTNAKDLTKKEKEKSVPIETKRRGRKKSLDKNPVCKKGLQKSLSAVNGSIDTSPIKLGKTKNNIRRILDENSCEPSEVDKSQNKSRLSKGRPTQSVKEAKKIKEIPPLPAPPRSQRGKTLATKKPAIRKSSSKKSLENVSMATKDISSSVQHSKTDDLNSSQKVVQSSQEIERKQATVFDKPDDLNSSQKVIQPSQEMEKKEATVIDKPVTSSSVTSLVHHDDLEKTFQSLFDSPSRPVVNYDFNKTALQFTPLIGNESNMTNITVDETLVNTTRTSIENTFNGNNSLEIRNIFGDINASTETNMHSEQTPDLKNLSGEQSISRGKNISEEQYISAVQNISREQNISGELNISREQNISAEQNISGEQNVSSSMLNISKNVTLGSSEYRFEQLSENSVKVYITRKRRRKLIN